MRDPEALAMHWHAAGAEAKAVRWFVRAAARARRALAFDHAAQLYQHALSCVPADSATARGLVTRLGRALGAGGRGPESADALFRAAEGADAEDRFMLQIEAAGELLRSGHVERGLAALRDIFRALGLKMPSTPRRALIAMLFTRARIRMRGLAFEPRSREQIPRRDLLRLEAC